MKNKYKQWLSNIFFAKTVFFLINFFQFNKIKIRGNTFKYNLALLINVDIQIKGRNNQVVVENFARLKNCRIKINGNNNKIIIGNNCSFYLTEFWIEDDYNEIYIGKNTSFTGKTHLAAIEGTKISIGENCLLSSDIHFRTGDSHSIIDLNGNRINPSQGILIGNHVWIGAKVTCLKGVTVPDNCVVGYGSLLTKKYLIMNSIIAGVPAKLIRENINWKTERI
jgi:acetyltransferase-like isoleucine patch superfamily enzyme